MLEPNTKSDRHPFTGPPPAWLPDWTKPETYPDHGDSSIFWAWEFIRRNPQYIADFKHFNEVPWIWPPEPDNPEGGGHTPKGCGRSFNSDAPMLYFYADPPALSPEETVGDYTRRTGIEPVQLECHLLRRWGISPISDPSETPASLNLASEYLDGPRDEPPYEFNLVDSKAWDGPHPEMWRYGWTHSGVDVKLRMEIEGGQRKYPDFSQETHMFFAFDLRVDPKRQVDAAYDALVAAREMLEEVGVRVRARKGKAGPQLGKLVDYLRVYDAVWMGEKQTSIALAFFGNKKVASTADSLISGYLAKARALISGGY